MKDDMCYTLMNVYAPNVESMQVKFYDVKELFIDEYCYDDERIIIGGNFNCIMNAKLDIKGGHERVKENVVEKITDIMDSSD